MKRALAAFVLLTIPAVSFASDLDVPLATTVPDLPSATGSDGRTKIPFDPLGPTFLGTDVVVSSLAGTEAEVTMDINPTNPLNMVACGHAPGFGTMNTFYTTDGGQTWTRVSLGDAQDGITSTFRFDPMVVFDAQGRVFVAYGVRNFDGGGNRQETVVVARSTNGGQSYTQFVQVSTQASIGTLPGNDRWGLATGRDPGNASQENVYIAWTQNVVESGNTDQRLVMSRSTNGGAAFSAPMIIADDAIAGIDRALTADPGVGPNGEVYISWHDFGDGQVVVDRSTDGGVTWGTDVVVHNLSFTGLFINPTPQFDRGVGAGPVLDVDESGGAFNGRVYIAYLDGPVTDTNVFVRRSSDGGANWSAAVQLNDDGGTNSQFLPWVDVDQTNGRVSAIFYDARDDVNDRTVHIYHTVSTDGGATFGTNTRVSDNPSNQSTSNPNRYLGNYLEYIGLTSWNCEAYAIWADCSADPSDLDFYFDSIPLGNSTSIACPSDIVVECTQHGGTPATHPAIAAFLNGATGTDACGNPVAITNDAPGVFPEGPTTVTFTNSFDNAVTCTADVTIVDTTPPTITFCPDDMTVECSSHCGVAKSELAAWLDSFAATDACDASPTLSNDAPDCFPLGATVVTFTATDDENLSSQCQATITVEDTTPPEIDVVLDRESLWPPNHKLVDVCIETITVTDICDPNPTWVLFDAESDEPDNGNGDGNTDDDIQGAAFGTADECLELRSERQGGGDGRTYTIYYEAMDMSGNTAYDTLYVRVPHDQSGAALAAQGFSADGRSLSGDGGTFALVIPGTDAVDATALDVNRIYLGNTAGVLRATETRIVDVDEDGRSDLALFYSKDALADLTSASVSFDLSDNAVKKPERGDGPLGVHFTTPTGRDYLVSDIFALGEPVELPTEWALAPPTVVPDERVEPVVSKDTALSSVHPNPFNPQTTVSYTLAGETRVRIAIYDVRGSLVRRLVDGSQPAGAHHAVWNGSDDAGRPATSGIYFVRMIAGSYSEVRKIVMLK